MQADVELDQELGTSVPASERGSETLGGDEAVDRDGQLEAFRGEPCQTVPRIGTERRVVDEDSGSARLVEDLCFACFRDGQTSGTDRELSETDLRRLVCLGVGPKRDRMRVDVGLKALEVRFEAFEIEDRDRRFDLI